MAGQPATLVYDGDCGICTAAAAWLGRRVAPARLRLVAVSEVAADPGLEAALAGRDLLATLHLARADGGVLTGARAVLAAARLVPRWRVLAIVFDQRVGHALLEPVYRRVARHRRQIGRLLGLPASCPMPAASERPR
jgi:predicted DCC family thiol-disulfide oxidoreductase YuxK